MDVRNHRDNEREPGQEDALTQNIIASRERGDSVKQTCEQLNITRSAYDWALKKAGYQRRAYDDRRWLNHRYGGGGEQKMIIPKPPNPRTIERKVVNELSVKAVIGKPGEGPQREINNAKRRQRNFAKRPTAPQRERDETTGRFTGKIINEKPREGSAEQRQMIANKGVNHRQYLHGNRRTPGQTPFDDDEDIVDSDTELDATAIMGSGDIDDEKESVVNYVGGSEALRALIVSANEQAKRNIESCPKSLQLLKNRK